MLDMARCSMGEPVVEAVSGAEIITKHYNAAGRYF